ncbi:MAG: flippase [Chloroflexota bacterium]
MEQPTLPKFTALSDATDDMNTLARGASTALVGKTVGRFLQMLVQIVIGRLLGPALFGLYSIGLAVLQTVGIFLQLGLDNGVIRYGTSFWQKDPRKVNSIVIRSVTYALISGLVIGIGFYLLAPFLAVTFFKKPDLEPVFRLFAFSFPFASALGVAAAATTISRRMKYSVIAETLIVPLANFALVVAANLLHTGLTGSIVATVLSFVVGFGFALRYLTILFPGIFKNVEFLEPTLREILRFSLPTALASMIYMLILRVDRLFAGYFLTAADVGNYQAMTQFSLPITLVMTSFNTIFAPMIASLHQSGRKTDLEELYRISTKWGLYIVLPFALVILAAPGEIVPLIFGDKYAATALPLVILMIAALVNVSTGSVGRILVMSGYQNDWLWLTAGAFVVDIILCIIFIPMMGIAGAALGPSVAVIALMLGGLWRVRQAVGIWPYDRRYWKGAIATLVTLAVLLVLRLFVLQTPWLFFTLAIILAFGVFAGTLFLIGLDKEDKTFLQTILKRLRKYSGNAA